MSVLGNPCPSKLVHLHEGSVHVRSCPRLMDKSAHGQTLSVDKLRPCRALLCMPFCSGRSLTILLQNVIQLTHIFVLWQTPHAWDMDTSMPAIYYTIAHLIFNNFPCSVKSLVKSHTSTPSHLNTIYFQFTTPAEPTNALITEYRAPDQMLLSCREMEMAYRQPPSYIILIPFTLAMSASTPANCLVSQMQPSRCTPPFRLRPSVAVREM